MESKNEEIEFSNTKLELKLKEKFMDQTKYLSTEVLKINKKIEKQNLIVTTLKKTSNEIEKYAILNTENFKTTLFKIKKDGRNSLILFLFGLIILLYFLMKV